jgi:hypothetical protein
MGPIERDSVEVEIGWRDQHGDRGHVLLGHYAVNRYACPKPAEASSATP